MRYQLNRLQQFAKLESRGVCGSKPGSHGALQHVSPLTTTINISILVLSTLQLRSSATKYMGSFIFHKTPTP